jgi:group I intron endonuclease
MYKVYKIVNSANNKIYIGRTSKSLYTRFTKHLNAAKSNSYYRLHAAIRKHGIDKFSIELLCETEILEFSAKIEEDLIRSYNSNSYEFGYNMTSGGLGELRSKESYKKQGEKLRRVKRTPEWNLRVSKGVRKALKEGRVKHPYKGKKMPKDKTVNMTGNKDAGKHNVILKGHKIMEIKSGNKFNSINQAAEFYNICDSSIARSIKNNKPCKNLIFTYHQPLTKS